MGSTWMGGLPPPGLRQVHSGQYPRCLSRHLARYHEVCLTMALPLDPHTMVSSITPASPSACKFGLPTLLFPNSSVVVFSKVQDFSASLDFGGQATPTGQSVDLEEGMGSGSNDGGLGNNPTCENSSEAGKEELFLTWSQVGSLALVPSVAAFHHARA
jgi:hypothetical protein